MRDWFKVRRLEAESSTDTVENSDATSDDQNLNRPLIKTEPGVTSNVGDVHSKVLEKLTKKMDQY